MIKFQDIKVGDYLLAEQDGITWSGEVTNLNGDEKEICVDNGVQEFWFKPEELKPLHHYQRKLLFHPCLN